MGHPCHLLYSIMRRALCLSSVFLAALGSANAGDVDLDIVAHFIDTPNTIIYVNAAATGEANGSSWADAYPTITKAIADAADGETIYVAQGVYIEKLSLTKSLKIYGGFPGLSMEETLADRNLEAYQTIVTPSTAAQTTAVWQHVEPDMDNYTFKTANSTNKLISADGKVKLPSFTGDYDSWASSAPASATMIYANGAYTNWIDGLWIVNGTQWIQNGNGAVTTVANCNFIGGGAGPSIQGYDSNRSTSKYLCLTNCLFYGAKMAAWRGGFLMSYGGDYVIDNCRIVGFVNNAHNTTYGGCVVYYWSGGKFIWRDSTFTRAIINNGTPYNEDMKNACFSYESGTFSCLYDNFAVTNNILLASGGVWCYPFFSSSLATYFKNLDFSRNFFVIKPTYTSSINQYMMFARRAVNVNNSTFADNTIYVPQAASSEGPFYAAIATMNANAYRPMVNCIFKNNSIKMKDTIGMTPTFGQLLVSGSGQLGLANCTFTHTDVDTYDIALPGATAQQHTVVNCLFERNGGEDQYQPFLLSEGATLNLVNSSVAGMKADDFRTPGTLTFNNSDAIPFALDEEKVDGYANQVLRPAALSPSMRDSRPVAIDSFSTTTVFGHVYTNAGTSFSYKSGETTWVALVPKQGKTANGKFGLITDAIGEERTEASFTRGAVQNPVQGTENAPTLTILKEPWAGGTISPALSVAADDETGTTPAVTANPAFDDTTVTWYEADGSTVLASGATLPAQTLPANKTVIASFDTPSVTVTFNLDGAGVFADGTDQQILNTSAGRALDIPSYTLNNAIAEEWLPYKPPLFAPSTNAVFTLKWVSTDVRVFRVAPGGTGDGSSWQNAAGDLDAVIADAGRYRGEVWFKKGTYAINEPLHIMANVGLYGGFDGTETSRSEASGTPSETVLTGAQEDGAITSRAFITDNIGTNFTVQSFTITSFASMLMQTTQQHGMLFRDCIFTNTTGIAFNVYARTTFDSCIFSKVSRVAYFNENTPNGTVFTNCVFRNNTTPNNSFLFEFGNSGRPNVYFRYCDFIGNTVPGTSGGIIKNQQQLTITDCNFSGNSAYYLIWQDSGSSMMRMYRTKITDNKFNFGFRNRDGAYNVFRDCYIADNNKDGGKRGTLFTFDRIASAWQLIQNTVMRNNTTSAALIETRLHQIVNCMILDTIFTGSEKADVKSVHNNDKGINILNTVFRNSTEGYVAVKNGLTTTLKARYASVVMSGELDPAITIDWSSDLVTNVYAKVRRPVLTKGNVASMQLSGSSPYARMGKLPYIDGSFNVFFYDTTASVWRKLAASGTFSKSGTAAKDAFGDPWSEDGVSLGPLNFMPISPTLLIIR